MNTLERVVMNHFPAYDTLVPEDKDWIQEQIILFLFRGISSARLSQLLSEVLVVTSKIIPFRKELTNNGYIIQNLKAAIWMKTTKYLKKCDHCILDLAKNSVRITSTLEEVYSKFKRVGLTKTNKAISQMLSTQCNEYTEKFIQRKMRFITTSQSHLSYSDIKSDLYAEAIRSTWLMYPYIESKLHLKNFIKRVIHNCGINFIHYWTNDSRKNIVAIDGGYQKNILNFSQVLEGTIGQDGDSYTLSKSSQYLLNETLVDFKLDLDRIVSKNRYTKKQISFIKILMGLDKNFDNWSAFKGYKFTSSDTLVYAASSYLNVNQQKILKFMARLQVDFIDYKNVNLTSGDFIYVEA